ncbi:MAG: type II secretion system major pseudopilin GspG, partial [Verrucomicrobia bacterium]|nr:type II secretion system major pseudopilin GspG [Verrucomicrobiota bacterium]
MKNVQTHDRPSSAPLLTLRRQRGFTLMEILLVMALLGGLIILGLGPVGKILVGGQEDTARIFVNDTMKASLFRYRIDNGRYPTTEEGLQSLMTAPAGATNWKGPYMESMPLDPWNRDFQYRFPGKNNTDKYDIYSLGNDGVESGDDIGNW